MFLHRHLNSLIQREPRLASTLEVTRNETIYHCGERDDYIYLVCQGQIKTIMYSRAGKTCLLEIYTGGDIFGELSLLGQDRAEAAVAMRTSVLRRIPYLRLQQTLAAAGLFEGFAQYMAARLAEQQETIARLVTMESELRLAALLLRLARKIGKRDALGLRLDVRITQEELSEMVGTTRSRIGHFLKRFRESGLVERNPRSFLIVNERRLSAFLEHRQ